MRQRGRQSAEALTLSPGADFYSADAPDYLTAEQKEVWRIVVNRLGSEWFPPETLPMLEQYCCATVIARSLMVQMGDTRISADIRHDARREWSRYAALMAQLASKLRITTQSTRRENTARPKLNATPWQT